MSKIEKFETIFYLHCFFSGAFFIPYCIALAFLGIPIFLLELAIGQYSSAGPFTCWKYSPIFTGKFIDKHISMI